MRLWFPRFLLFAVAIALCSCTSPDASLPAAKKRTVTIAGSTSVMPFSEKLAEHFKLENPRVTVDVQGGGSSAGVQACMNKTVDIGMSSRELKGAEKVLKEIVICHDGIAVIVNRRNPIKHMSLEIIMDVYSGKIRNWKELGWIDRNIDAVTREEGSGTRSAFEELVMGQTEINESTMVQDSNGSVKEVVATDPYAIGYISLGVVDDKVRALLVDGVPPTLENIQTKKYRIVRPFLYLTMGDALDASKLFINFVLSETGQTILGKEGLIPVNE